MILARPLVMSGTSMILARPLVMSERELFRAKTSLREPVAQQVRQFGEPEAGHFP